MRSEATPHFLRFYARCFVYPYEEMNYELQHLYRQIELLANEDEAPYVEQLLIIVNQYQGEEIKLFRDQYVLLFSNWQSEQPICPLTASDFLRQNGRHFDSEPIQDLSWELGLITGTDEAVDSITNLLEICSVLYEQEMEEGHPIADIHEFQNQNINNWIPLFCDRLYAVSEAGFFREIAAGLKEYLNWLQP